jgi:hypothetical protein
MIINSSPCLKYSRPRFAAKRPTQHRVQISPVKSRALLGFISRDNYHNLTRLDTGPIRIWFAIDNFFDKVKKMSALRFSVIHLCAGMTCVKQGNFDSVLCSTEKLYE